MKANISVRDLVITYGLFSLVVLIAATNYIFCKWALEVITPYALMSVRYLLAAGLLVFLVLPRKKHFTKSLALTGGALGLVLSFAVITWQFGIAESDHIGPAAFIVSLDGLMVPLFAALIFRDVLTPNVLLALPLGLLGLGLLNYKQGMSVSISDVWFFICAFGFSAHILLTHRFAQRFDSICFVWVQLATVSVVTTIFALIFEADTITLSSLYQVRYELLYLAVVATAIRFVFQNYAQGRVSASGAGFLFITEPVLVAILAWIVLSETFSQMQILGSAFIFIAVILARMSYPFNWFAMRSRLRGLFRV